MTMPHATRPCATTAWLVEQLREAIIAGELAAGEPVRQEEIAARFAVSRMPVREALQRLEVEGWLEHRPYRGAYVAPLDAADVSELFAARAALEALAARRTFAHLDTGQVAAIERALTALEESVAGDAWFAAHRAFHLSLYSGVGPRLQRLIGQQLDAAERYLRIENVLLEVVDKDRREHRALVAAAKAGDGERAAAVIDAHVGEAGETLAAGLRGRSQGARR